jgi:hypothetical protein
VTARLEGVSREATFRVRAVLSPSETTGKEKAWLIHLLEPPRGAVRLAWRQMTTAGPFFVVAIGQLRVDRRPIHAWGVSGVLSAAMPSSPPRPLDERQARLVAALVDLREQPLSSRRWAWLNTWNGVGAIVTGMTRHGFDLELMQQPHGWWARFYLSSATHTVCAGSGWAVMPWGAVQEAAWQTLTTGNPKARLQEQLAAPRSEQRPDPRVGPAGDAAGYIT